MKLVLFFPDGLLQHVGRGRLGWEWVTDSSDYFLPVGLLAQMRGSTRGVLIRATCLCREDEERAEACTGYDDYGDRRLDLCSAGFFCRLAHDTRGVAGACILFVTGHAAS